MTAQTWSSDGYAKNARFVTDLGTPVLELLAPRPGEHILDVGCGDGVLTKKIADLGCSVVGVDSSAEFVASARKLGLTVVQKSVECVRERIKPHLCDTTGKWTADYVRLRFAAHLTH
jgi:2-polyprenyl-3-methyl-5-hydroxy-6-metoxy-1,4-benzoquinol methylase